MNTRQEIETESLKIHGNCMKFNDAVIQLNIFSSWLLKMLLQ